MLGDELVEPINTTARTITISGPAVPSMADGEPALQLSAIHGSETLSEVYAYVIDCVTPADAAMPETSAANLDLKAMVGKELTVTVQLDGVAPVLNSGGQLPSDDSAAQFTREISGIVASASFEGQSNRQSHYRLTMKPWIHVAVHRSDYRIFQNRTVVEIVEEVLGAYPYSYDMRLGSQYPKLVYQVQYGETDLAFIQRLMQEHGIYWFFEHSKQVHRMVLVDHLGAHSPVQSVAYRTLRYHPPGYKIDNEYVNEFNVSNTLQSARWSTSDFNFKKPGARLAVAAELSLQGGSNLEITPPRRPPNGNRPPWWRHPMPGGIFPLRWSNLLKSGPMLRPARKELGIAPFSAGPRVGPSPENPYDEPAMWSEARDVATAAGGSGFVGQAPVPRQGDSSKEAAMQPGLEGGAGSAYNGLERYEWPGDYTDAALGEFFARVRMEEVRSQAERASGGGNVRAVVCGTTFKLENHPCISANQEYLVLGASLDATETVGATGVSEFQLYTSFVVQPATTVFRPPRTVARPRTSGPQTAIVTGPEGQEIWTDQYGRVKLKFHWDRSPVRDHNSSCWVRVSYPWTGSGFGGIHIPRVGSEVIVDFENGDPDRPIVTGQVYNAHHMPPWSLPGNATQSGFLTRSVKGGAPENANAIRFEDSRGQEEVWIKAEKDLRVDVRNDETVNIGGSRTETIGNSEMVNILAQQNITIGGMHTQQVGLTSDVSVGASYTLSAMGAIAISAGLTSDESVGMSKSTTVSNSYSINAGDRFELTVGDSSIVLERDGSIKICGKNVQIQGDVIDLN